MKCFKAGAMLVVLVLLNVQAFAQEKTDPKAGGLSIGGLLGATVPLGDGDTRFTWGAEGAYGLSDKIAAGIYFTTSSDTTGSGIFEVDNSLSYLTAFADYFVGPDFYVGPMIGLALASVDAAGEVFDDTSTDLVIGARTGLDLSVGSGVTVGPEANLIVSTAEGSDPVLNILGAAKYHF